MLKFITALLFALCLTTSYTQFASEEFVFQAEDEIYFPESEIVVHFDYQVEEHAVDECMQLISKAMNLETNELNDLEEEPEIMVQVDATFMEENIEGKTVISTYIQNEDEEEPIIVNVDIDRDVEGETYTVIEEDDNDGEIVVTVDASFMNEDSEGETVISLYVDIENEEEDDIDSEIVVNVDATFISENIEGEMVISTYVSADIVEDEEDPIVVNVDASFMKEEIEGEVVVATYVHYDADDTNVHVEVLDA